MPTYIYLIIKRKVRTLLEWADEQNDCWVSGVCDRWLCVSLVWNDFFGVHILISMGTRGENRWSILVHFLLSTQKLSIKSILGKANKSTKKIKKTPFTHHHLNPGSYLSKSNWSYVVYLYERNRFSVQAECDCLLCSPRENLCWLILSLI